MLLNERGQTLVEYVLIIAFITVVIIGLVNTFGGYLKDSVTKASCGMVGQDYVKGEKTGHGYCE